MKDRYSITTCQIGSLLDSKYSKLANEFTLHFWTLIYWLKKNLYPSVLCFALSAFCTRGSPDSFRFF